MFRLRPLELRWRHSSKAARENAPKMHFCVNVLIISVLCFMGYKTLCVKKHYPAIYG